MPRQSIGSGVIIDAAEGLVVTNHHVVQGADSIVVTLSDRREFNAMLVGSDAGTDVALLRVMADDAAFAEIPIGDSSGLAVGDYVVAIGNPFGLGQTATAGIVERLGRSGVNVESYEDFIQTDASINPGNSGGALVDIDGQLLGVNTAILSGDGRQHRHRLRDSEQHGSRGRRAAPRARQRAARTHRPRDSGRDAGPRAGARAATDRGALVTQIEPGSPAEQAGIQPGDVIVAINGKPIDSSADLRNEIGLVRAGDSVEVTSIRDGERRTVRATVAAETGGGAASARAADPASVSLLAGATIMELPSDHPAYGRVQGVWVSAVAPGSAAARFGLRADDVITGVNREPIASVAGADRGAESRHGRRSRCRCSATGAPCSCSCADARGTGVALCRLASMTIHSQERN